MKLKTSFLCHGHYFNLFIISSIGKLTCVKCFSMHFTYIISHELILPMKDYKGFQVALGDAGDTGSIPRLGRSPEGGHSSPLQYSCLENPMDREEPGGLQFIGSQRVGHDGSNWACARVRPRVHTHTHTHTHTRTWKIIKVKLYLSIF